MSVSVCVQMPPAAYNPYPLQLAFSIGGAASGSGTELRKRTTSFSCPSTGSASRPRKRLHRTESVVDLTLLAREAACPPPPPINSATPLTTPPPVPYTRTLKFYKEQKERRRAVMRRETLCAPVPTPVDSPSVRWHVPTAAPVSDPAPSARLPPTSPLARCEFSLSNDSAQPLARALVLPPPPSSQSACGPAHPPPPCARARSKSKSKPTADLHRRALTACMRASPAGAKILHMGARLAVGIMAATRELEQMCGEEDGMSESDVEEEDVVAAEAMVGADADVPMPDADSGSDSDSDADADSEPEEPAMSASWVVVGERPAVACGREIVREYGVTRDDWEMVAVECVA